MPAVSPPPARPFRGPRPLAWLLARGMQSPPRGSCPPRPRPRRAASWQHEVRPCAPDPLRASGPPVRRQAQTRAARSANGAAAALDRAGAALHCQRRPELLERAGRAQPSLRDRRARGRASAGNPRPAAGGSDDPPASPGNPRPAAGGSGDPPASPGNPRPAAGGSGDPPASPGNPRPAAGGSDDPPASPQAWTSSTARTSPHGPQCPPALTAPLPASSADRPGHVCARDPVQQPGGGPCAAARPAAHRPPPAHLPSRAPES